VHGVHLKILAARLEIALKIALLGVSELYVDEDFDPGLDQVPHDAEADKYGRYASTRGFELELLLVAHGYWLGEGVKFAYEFAKREIATHLC